MISSEIVIAGIALSLLLAATYVFRVHPYLDERETMREFETGSSPA